MKDPVLIYIGLGSNLGDRLQTLQNATYTLYQKVGEITAISRVYETPAWGFEGNNFLNACLAIKTRFSAHVVLDKLQSIERKFGRPEHQNTSGYQNRTLDLDLLFYGTKQIQSKRLTLPHPEIAHRRFVLQPLADIAADFTHPQLQKNIGKLLKDTADPSTIQVTKAKLPHPKTSFKEVAYLAIEGNIGAGKTSLSTMISQDFNAKLITERFKDNPFLPKFYQDQARYAFPLEMSFLADRYQQLIDDIGQYDLFNDFVVADYDIYKSLVFAQVTLAEEEFRLYKKLFQIMYKEMAKPDLYVYLYQDTERLLQNIKKRGREYEQNINPDYLEKINRGYLDFIKAQNHLNVKILEVSSLDFVQNREDYLLIIERINAAI